MVHLFSPDLGVERFYQNMEMMYGFRISPYMKIAWVFTAPVFSIVSPSTDSNNVNDNDDKDEDDDDDDSNNNNNNRAVFYLLNATKGHKLKTHK